MDNELYHHGIKGQKWGVRRFQNKDGSLTLAGKKRALKMQKRYTELYNDKKYRDKQGNLTYAGRRKALVMKERYSELTGKDLRKFTPKTNGSDGGKTKSISEMTNTEIQAKIDRIRLENTLKSLTPKQTSKGEKFINGVKDAALSALQDKGAKLIGDYIDKKLRDTLGLSTKNTADALQSKAKEYENRLKIDKAQRYFKEGKYAEQKGGQNSPSQTEGQSSSSDSSKAASDKVNAQAKTAEREAKAEERRARAEERRSKATEPKYNVTGEGSSSRTSPDESNKTKPRPNVINLKDMGGNIYGYDPEVEKRIRALLGSGK